MTAAVAWCRPSRRWRCRRGCCSQYATLPAKTVVSVGYAAVETRPTATPNVYMLVNGGRAGLRARPVFFMPPEGLLLPPGQRPLGLQVALLGQNQFRVKTASNSLKSNLEVTSTDGLRKVLEDIKKRNPSKDAAVLDVSEGALGDLLNVIMLAQETFPRSSSPPVSGSSSGSARTVLLQAPEVR